MSSPSDKPVVFDVDGASEDDKAILGVHSAILGEGFEAFTKGHSAAVDKGALAEGWRGAETWCFWYRHPRSSAKFEMKGVVVAGQVVAVFGDGTSVRSLAVPGGDTALKGAVHSLFTEAFLPTKAVFADHHPEQTRTIPDPTLAAARPQVQQPYTGPDALRDYGRGDLMPGAGGGNLMGPEVFRNFMGNRGQGEMFGPDGEPVCNFFFLPPTKFFFEAERSVLSSYGPPRFFWKMRNQFSNSFQAS